jgi:hypothetical protein
MISILENQRVIRMGYVNPQRDTEHKSRLKRYKELIEVLDGSQEIDFERLNHIFELIDSEDFDFEKLKRVFDLMENDLLWHQPSKAS